MRQITIIILTFLFSTVASANCSHSGIYCLSKTSTLNKNGLIILEFYALSQLLISDLNTKYPIYLKSPNEKVQLNVIETLTGEKSLTQVVLKPATELKVDELYTLQIDNLPNYERQPESYNSTSKKWESSKFKINKIVDNDIPTLNNTPTEQKKTLVYYGCGPESWVYFAITGHDESELFVRANVKNKEKGKVTTYILTIENGVTLVGHGMCSGAFKFDSGSNFEVTFQLFDQSGNKSNSSSEIAFTKPAIESNND
ncbi:MAG TPA: hypothetical protein PLQ57_13440 [Saprospiraceae bacterium]|nr:hypothetical protein [Saprospiraceae bacterium]